MEPHLPHIVDGCLVVRDGHATLTFSDYDVRGQAPGLTGSYIVSYEAADMHARWGVYADDYPNPLHEFIDRCADRHAQRFEDRWMNSMADILLVVRCDGLGHFRLSIQDAIDRDERWFARGSLSLDTSSMAQFSKVLRLFMSPPF